MYINVTIVNQFDYAVCLDWLRMKQKHIVKKIIITNDVQITSLQENVIQNIERNGFLKR